MSDNYDNDSLDEFVAKEAEITEETENLKTSSRNAFVDSDGNENWDEVRISDAANQPLNK